MAEAPRNDSPEEPQAPAQAPKPQAKPKGASEPMRFLRRTTAFILSAAIVGVIVVGGANVVWQMAERSPAPPLLDGIDFSPAVYSAEGELLRLTPAKDGIYRVKTPLAQIDPKLIDATLFYEDRLFRNHKGVNPGSIVRAGMETLMGSRRMGASTITMQLARMRLKLRTNTFEGKIRQIWHALRYETHYSKDEILEAYLNLAPYGGNVEGAGAASRVWFHKPPSMLRPLKPQALPSSRRTP